MASGTVVCLIASSLLLFGIPVWSAFIEFFSFTQTIVLETGGTGWQKNQSVFSAVRMWGGSAEIAYALQALAALLSLAMIARLRRIRVEFEIRACALLICSLLVTPYLMDYDLMVLGLCIAFHVAMCLRSGFLPYEKSLLAVVWLSPLLTRAVAEHTLIPLSLLTMLAMLGMILHRALRRPKPGRKNRRQYPSTLQPDGS